MFGRFTDPATCAAATMKIAKWRVSSWHTTESAMRPRQTDIGIRCDRDKSVESSKKGVAAGANPCGFYIAPGLLVLMLGAKYALPLLNPGNYLAPTPPLRLSSTRPAVAAGPFSPLSMP